jgi:hypothetical protein
LAVSEGPLLTRLTTTKNGFYISQFQTTFTWFKREGLRFVSLVLTSTGLSLSVDGSPAIVSPLAFASRRFLDHLVAAGASDAGGSSARRGLPVTGPGAEVMAQLAAAERLVREYACDVCCDKHGLGGGLLGLS